MQETIEGYDPSEESALSKHPETAQPDRERKMQNVEGVLLNLKEFGEILRTLSDSNRKEIIMDLVAAIQDLLYEDRANLEGQKSELSGRLSGRKAGSFIRQALSRIDNPALNGEHAKPSDS